MKTMAMVTLLVASLFFSPSTKAAADELFPVDDKWYQVVNSFMQAQRENIDEIKTVAFDGNVWLNHCGGFDLSNAQVIQSTVDRWSLSLPFNSRDNHSKVFFELDRLAYAFVVLENSSIPKRYWSGIYLLEVYQTNDGWPVLILPQGLDGESRRLRIYGPETLAKALDGVGGYEVWGSAECGGGEVDVFVRTVPSGARVWHISDFNYELCDRMGGDLNDLSSCWLEVTGTSMLYISGYVRFFARWPDGRTHFSRRDISVDAYDIANSDSINDALQLDLRPD